MMSELSVYDKLAIAHGSRDAAKRDAEGLLKIIKRLRSQLTEALKPKVCRWRERMGTGETEHIPSCPQFKKAGISKAYLCPSGEMYCVFCGGKIEVV